VVIDLQREKAVGLGRDFMYDSIETDYVLMDEKFNDIYGVKEN